MSQTAIHPAQQVVDLSFGFILSSALAAAAEMGVADHLAAGPQPLIALAAQLKVDARSLYRLLRMLASVGIFHEDAEARFHLTPAADLLRKDVPGSLRDAVLMITQDIFWKPAGEFPEVVRSGENGMLRIFGLPFFDYLSSNDKAGNTFHRGMSSLSDMENAPIAGAYDFSGCKLIADIGGGHGGFLIEVLKCAPQARGLLFDHRQVLDQARIDQLPERWNCIEGDFFATVPSGADVYILKRIIHDWTDEVCIRILKNIRHSMPAGAKVLVVDTVIPSGNDPHGGKLLDVLMMAALPGRERTKAEFSQLFAEAGLKLSRVIHTPTLLSITEAVAADS